MSWLGYAHDGTHPSCWRCETKVCEMCEDDICSECTGDWCCCPCRGDPRD